MSVSKWEWFVDHAMVPLVVFLCFTFLIGVCVMAYRESTEWEAFKTAHACRIVGKVASSPVVLISPDGKASFGATDSKTGWRCDDGITYWK